MTIIAHTFLQLLNYKTFTTSLNSSLLFATENVLQQRHLVEIFFKLSDTGVSGQAFSQVEKLVRRVFVGVWLCMYQCAHSRALQTLLYATNTMHCTGVNITKGIFTYIHFNSNFILFFLLILFSCFASTQKYLRDDFPFFCVVKFFIAENWESDTERIKSKLNDMEMNNI